ncbi:DUF222 domain-containing protein [Agromyces silvae]|uniref:DUF222 domain-containing protein n=1 Tax=Agromyces silvae TaxID=3388266 RepID=UPI00280BEF38|nr:DUF222 domain-containing protein [Agromyces protaetiae]
MKNSSLDRLRAGLGALAETWAGGLPAFGAGAVGADAVGDEFEALSGPGLVRVVEEVAGLRRSLDAVLARAADEVAKRSAPGFGADGLAKQHGYASPARLVAAATGGAPAEASRLLAVGEATRARASFTGELLPAKFAAVRRALDDGALSVDAAAAITGMLRRVEVRAEASLLEPYEQKLVEFADGQPFSLIQRAVKAAEARLDEDGAQPADERMFAARALTLHEDGHGMFQLRGRLDPVTAAPIKAALDALVSDALARRRSHEPGTTGLDGTTGATGLDGTSGTTGLDGTTGTTGLDDTSDATGLDGTTGTTGLDSTTGTTGLDGTSDATGLDGPGGATGGPVVPDQRSIPQLQADALAELAKHALGCTAAPGTAPKTTIVVRMSLDALRTGTGLAEIDGIDRPIAAATARKLAADAELIPIVLGADSAPLDLGRATRLFTKPQRIALMERDGGCACCGANITYAEAHHIQWWARDHGRTDLANGVMLCTSCHHRIHDQGWRIHTDGPRIWFIPPPHIDPSQHPRLGGRARFDPTSPAWSARAARPPATPETAAA